jgi:phospholipid/cholesterol/gamma-HCH transport system permease protein
LRQQRQPYVTSSRAAIKPLRSIGEFFAMSLDALVLMFTPPFAWREFLLQAWFVARVSIVPTLMLAIPFTVLTVFLLNILLLEIGAADFSGAGAALGAVTQIGPIVTVLVVAGAGATAMCADLGARTIREELDALRVLGINPVQALVVPRMLAAGVVATALVSVVTGVGLTGSFLFSVFFQHVTAGAFAASLTVITGMTDVIIALVKGALFGLCAGLIACYKGISVGGGPQGVGNAVNETVVYSFIALYVINVIATAVGVKVTL